MFRRNLNGRNRHESYLCWVELCSTCVSVSVRTVPLCWVELCSTCVSVSVRTVPSSITLWWCICERDTLVHKNSVHLSVRIHSCCLIVHLSMSSHCLNKVQVIRRLRLVVSLSGKQLKCCLLRNDICLHVGPSVNIVRHEIITCVTGSRDSCFMS